MSLKHKSIVSTTWLTFGIGLSQIISFITMLVVARFVAPSEYGLYTYGIITLAFVSVLARMGLVEALVQKSNLSDKDLSTAFVLSLFISFLSVMVITLVGYIFGEVTNNCGTVFIFLVLSLSSFAFGVQVVPEALLRRDMRFHVLSLSRILGATIGSVIAIFLILNDYGIWALVIQRVTIEVVMALYAWNAVTMQFKFIYFNVGRAIKLMRFGISIAGFTFVEVASNNVDQFIIGSIWGEHVLGLYAMAKRIVANIRQLLFMPVRQVTVSAVAKIKDNIKKIIGSYTLGSRIVSLIVFPMFFVLFVYAELIVNVLLGSKWEGVGVMLRLLSIILIFDAIKIMLPSILQSQNKPSWLFVERLILAVAGSAFLYVGAQFNVELGIVMLVAAYAITLFVSQLMIGKLLNVSVLINIMNVLPYFIVSGVAVFGVKVVANAGRIDVSNVGGFVVVAFASMFVYLILCLFATRTFKSDFSLMLLPVVKIIKKKI